MISRARDECERKEWLEKESPLRSAHIHQPSTTIVSFLNRYKVEQNKPERERPKEKSRAVSSVCIAEVGFF